MIATYQLDFGWVPDNLDLFVTAAWLTIRLMLGGAVLMVVLGVLAGQGLTSRHVWIRTPVRLYVDFFRLTPLLVQIIAIFFLLPSVLSINASPFVSGVIALGLNYGAFFAEVFKGGITSLDRGQWEAAQAMGMAPVKVLTRVIYPQAIRRMLPPLSNLIVSLTKDTSLVSVIGVAELLNTSQSVGAQTFRNIETLLFISVFYLIINLPLAWVATRLHRTQVVDA
jgi:polar amino acid transport system permease protein